MFRNAHAFPGAFFGYFIAQVQHNPVYGIVFVRQMISRCRINLQHSVCFPCLCAQDGIGLHGCQVETALAVLPLGALVEIEAIVVA